MGRVLVIDNHASHRVRPGDQGALSSRPLPGIHSSGWHLALARSSYQGNIYPASPAVACRLVHAG